MNMLCVKCHEVKEIHDVENFIMKNGRPAVRGKCLDCGTKVVKIVKSS